jgi:predicted lipid-binding transport protein (Tim44 family)
MKNTLKLLAVVAAVGLTSVDADAARRFGGGQSIGRQRPAPAMSEAAKAPASAAAPVPAKPAQAAPAPTAPQPQPSFMSRWGGMLAGLGIGALLGSMFGGNLGAGMGGVLLLLLVAGIGFMLLRAFGSRRAPEEKPMAFAGIGSAVLPAAADELNAGAIPPAPAGVPIPGFEVEPFIRVAKTSFIRLQAANDAKDLDDIRDYTTPEMYAELAMQIGERDDAPQKTEVVMLDAKLVEAVVEDNYAVASVRFSGLIREADAANPDPFDEIWHVRKNLRDPKGAWLIAGIQQQAA